jgi:hypothetical protein
MRRTETLKTADFAYECTQLGALEGRTALLRAQKIAVQGVNGLDAMVNAMTPNDLDYFCSIFSKQTRVIMPDGKRPLLDSIFDLHFAGDMAFEMVEWLAFCLGLNFGVFFQKIQNQGEKIKQAALAGTGQAQPSDPEPSESPNP